MGLETHDSSVEKKQRQAAEQRLKAEQLRRARSARTERQRQEDWEKAHPRLGKELVQRNLAWSEDDAAWLIAQSRVKVGGKVATQPGIRIEAGAVLAVRSARGDWIENPHETGRQGRENRAASPDPHPTGRDDHRQRSPQPRLIGDERRPRDRR
ncbi:hypothetical protein PHK61_08425 [Actinomycetospora lutea]|uniref:hypothetical protein n=1 Tax=Actinomycetospora lutea TaxID=663604 RepID=UPI002365EE3B|nr:hypothetical protein [Actinomycetospora lutea]MDD7938441.1 hypothetical protein [Actinomycetospora lutea]